MDEESAGLSDSEVAAKIEARLFPEEKKPEPAKTSEAATEQAAPEAEDASEAEAEEPEASETESDDGEIETAGDNAPDIEPPSSMSADEKAAFAQLTPEMKQFIARREGDRDRGTQKEAGRLTEDRKALEAAQKELSERTVQLTELAKQYRHPDINAFETRFADVLSGKTDLMDLAREDPVGFQEYQAMERKAIQAHHREQENQAKSQAEFKATIAKKQAETHERLAEKIPSWFGDQAKAEKSYKAIGEYLVKEYAMDPQRVSLMHEFAQIDIVRKAILYDRAQKTRTEKEKAATTPANPPPKVMRPGTTQSQGGKNEKTEALRKRLQKTGRVEDAARLIETML